MSVEANLRAFASGRAASVDDAEEPVRQDLAGFVDSRVADLSAYRNRAYADRYATLMAKVRAAADLVEGSEEFTWAVARSAYKLMAYKDEYEVARLYARADFRAALDCEFESVRKMRLQLAPPLLARIDPATGRPRKVSFGGWTFPALRILAAGRGLRKTPLDPFGYTAERRVERASRDTFLERIGKAVEELGPQNLGDYVSLAKLPMDVRGFGPVKHEAATGCLADMTMTGPNPVRTSAR